MKRFLLATIILFFSIPASAQWVAGGGYINLSDSEDGVSVDLGGIYGSLAYVIEAEGNLTFMPELRLGLGVSDDTISGVKVELDNFFAFSVRGQFDFDSGVYLYAAPSYARAELTASAFGLSVSDDDWEFGFGGGFGYKFSEQTWGELSYETFDGTDVLSIGLRYAF